MMLGNGGGHLTIPTSNLPQLPNLSFPQLAANGQFAPEQLTNSMYGGITPLAPLAKGQTLGPGIRPLGNDSMFGNLKLTGAVPGGGGFLGGLRDSFGGWGGVAKFGVDTAMGLGELYAAFQSLGLAKDQMETNKAFANINLENSTKQYNTRLTDRANARAHMEGMSDADRDSYIERNRLADRKV